MEGYNKEQQDKAQRDFDRYVKISEHFRDSQENVSVNRDYILSIMNEVFSLRENFGVGSGDELWRLTENFKISELFGVK